MNQFPKKILAHKFIGETPLEVILRLKKENPDLENEKMTYAGRLDPMAEGLLLVLWGDEIKNKDKYLGLNKEYEVEVLFGISSDTGDILGLAEAGDGVASFDLPRPDKILQDFVGKQIQKYPMFSSKAVGGKQMHQWAREGGLEEEIPEREIEIYSIENLGLEEKSGFEVLKNILERIDKVSGDFRQEEIKDKWQKILAGKEKEKFQILKIKVSCSSGTYMRVLAEEIGKKLSIKALAYSIKRTRLVDFGSGNC